MGKEKQIFFLIFLIILLVAINYQFLDEKLEESFSEYEGGVVERVIDGDTIVVNNVSVRLLGINSPEKSELYYNEAKEFLSKSVLNKKVKFEFSSEKYDKYDRMLAYIFINGENINAKLVEEGFANFYFPSGKDRFYDGFKIAWESCIIENKNLCEKSTDRCEACVILNEFNCKTEKIVLHNICEFDCELTGWKIKDEGRKVFIFPEFILKSKKEINIITGNKTNTKEILYWKNQDYVWTDTGDTLFLRDKNGKLVLWFSL